MRRTLLAALVLGTTLVGLGGAPASADPVAPSGACPDGSGITVVVDFRELGGGTATRCAPGPWGSGDTGFTALERAGFEVERVRQFPGALCRIDDRPSPQQDACVKMPPATAYWSYWLASRGGEWCYSNLGAGNRRAVAGSVEGWSFSKDRTSESSPPPGVPTPKPVGSSPPPTIGRSACPSEAPATTTTTRVPTTTTTRAVGGSAGPTPTTPSSGGPGAPQPSPGDAPSIGADGSDASRSASTTSLGTGPATPDRSPVGTVGNSTPTSSATRSADGGATDERELAAASRAGDDPGSPAGLLIGLGLVVALGGSAALASQLRRRGSAPS